MSRYLILYTMSTGNVFSGFVEYTSHAEFEANLSVSSLQ